MLKGMYGEGEMKSTYFYSHVIYHKPKIPPVLKLCFEFSDFNRGDTEQFKKFCYSMRNSLKLVFIISRTISKCLKTSKMQKTPFNSI